MLNRPIENSNAPIRADIREIVLERIVTGVLPPGVRVTESRLAEDLGVSRTPLREALINLEQEGFVRSELAHGFTVEPLSGREVREIYPILWTLEGLALRASASAIYAMLDDLAEINAALSRPSEPAVRLRLDTQWHERLLSQCPNHRLNSIIASLRMKIRRYEHLFMSDDTLITGSVSQHSRIIEALQNRDVDRATDIVVENWRVGMELLLVRLGEP